MVRPALQRQGCGLRSHVLSVSGHFSRSTLLATRLLTQPSRVVFFIPLSLFLTTTPLILHHATYIKHHLPHPVHTASSTYVVAARQDRRRYSSGIPGRQL